MIVSQFWAQIFIPSILCNTYILITDIINVQILMQLLVKDELVNIMSHLPHLTLFCLKSEFSAYGVRRLLVFVENSTVILFAVPVRGLLSNDLTSVDSRWW